MSSKNEGWDEFVKYVRTPAGPQVSKFIKEVMAEGMENFLFIANSQGPDPVIIRGMHYPDSDILENAGVTVFETSEKNIFLAAYRSSMLVDILKTIEDNAPKMLQEEIWEKTVERLVAAAESKIQNGEVSALF